MKKKYIKPRILIILVEAENSISAMSAVISPNSSGGVVETEWDAEDQNLSFEW